MSDLSALLEREASAEIASILAEARERASASMAAAQTEAEQLLAKRRRAAEVQRDAALVRARSAAQLEAAALKLQAQHAALEQVFEHARERLAGLPGDAKAYKGILQQLLVEALDDIGRDDVAVIEAAPADVATVAALAKAAKVDAPVEGDESLALGVRVRSQRHSAVENSLTARLDALEGELAAEVSRLLFAVDTVPSGATAPDGHAPDDTAPAAAPPEDV
ncbi:MAG: V-type ATP synthase subunit E [Trueperaceae bacterium]